MQLFPAIDILDGRAVRLLRGERDKVTDYGDPVDRARQWLDAGAKHLHVVDLSGAFEGSSRIDRVLERIAALGADVQSGGGLRTEEEIRRRLGSGANRVVLGTVCIRDPALFRSAVERYGAAVVAGMDVKEGYLALNGWTQRADVRAEAFAREAYSLGVREAVFTDIGRDGALSGVNVRDTAAMQETGLRIIASGGIRDLDDLRALREAGIYGAILGRSIYAGAIDLARAIREMEA